MEQVIYTVLDCSESQEQQTKIYRLGASSDAVHTPFITSARTNAV